MKKILVPTDFSKPATIAAEVAADIARRSGGEITLLHVIEEATEGSINIEGEASYGSNMNFLRAEAEKGMFEISPAYNYGGQKGKTPEGPMNFASINQQAKQMDGIAQ